MDRLEEIRQRAETATPGPWKWSVAECNHEIQLVTDHSGQYYVMEFERWGMQSACPSFQVYEWYSGPVRERGSKGMVRADKLAKSLPGKEHHHGFDDYIDHPDAAFIAHSREDMEWLLSEVDALNELLTASKAGQVTLQKAWEQDKTELTARAEAAEAERDALMKYGRCCTTCGKEKCRITGGGINVHGCGSWEWRGQQAGKEKDDEA